ncbi:hypothetical protein HJG53_07635 [Sphingomonas sp. ID1715]|uniref:hypothetical protein n=1 Tax=Sphingomonas sp. ID1715 TaxID=1656898 RepID=UPI001489FED6|nr:hypothetical protein [Sphingomonas sp. ID1715]NNM76767.1 hypothetical protein [Sphingomonas sp. ID1715]
MIRAALSVFALLLATPAVAADDAPAPIRGLAACRTIAQDAQRLACFDREAAALVASVEKKETVLLDKQEVTKTKRSLFGFSLPRLPFFNSGKDDGKEEPEFTQIETPIKTVRSIGYGKFRFSIDDGALWETTEGINAFPKVGQKVVIKKGVMGSYFIKFEGNRSVKGMRVG